ncbi:MAG: RsmB/NOP family class I SAM-dependent RNA methyltransferase [Rubrivivax sp.]
MAPRSLLELGATLLHEVLRLDEPADAVVATFLRPHRELGMRDRHALADMVHAVLRRWRWLERLARTAPSTLVAAAPGRHRPAHRAAARPQPSAPAASMALAALGWPEDDAFLARALDADERDWRTRALRSEPAGVDATDDALRLHLPAWIAADLRAQLGDAELAVLAAALNEAAPLDLRVNGAAGRRESARAALKADGFECTPTRWSPWGLRVEGKPSLAGSAVLQRGEVEVQDEGSQLLAALVEARRGETVVDFCAGAGGKTLALGAAMRDTGRLYALDTSGHRLNALRPRLARSGLSNVHTMQIAHERDDRLQRLAGKVDRVLVDAPCSGLGTLRRHPDLRWRQSAAMVEALALQQHSILGAAAGLLKPGGRLVYATCSLLTTENEVVAAAFDVHPEGRAGGFERLPAAESLLRAGVADAGRLCNGPDLRLWPHRHGTDGFYAAVWQKR